MELNEELDDRWVQEVWPKVCAVSDIVDVAVVSRARPEDIEEAKRLLSEFTEKAAAYLDDLSEYVRKQTEAQ